MTEYDYSPALALFDYIPVVFSAIGFVTLARLCGRQNPDLRTAASLGAMLIIAAGLSKASWKLNIALFNNDIPWMNNALFVGLSAGMLTLSLCVYYLRKNRSPALSPLWWVLPVWLLGLGVALYWPEKRLWVIPLLAVTTLANLALGLQLIQLALQAGSRLCATLFGFNLAMVFVMSGLSRAPQHTAGLQWLEQGLNTGAQLAFAFAAVKLYRMTVAEKSFQQKSIGENAS